MAEALTLIQEADGVSSVLDKIRNLVRRKYDEWFPKFALQPNPVGAKSASAHGSHQKRFHVVLEGRQPREVAEAESTRAPALRDDQLIALIGLFPGYGQDVLPPAEGRRRKHGHRDGRVQHDRRIGCAVAGNSVRGQARSDLQVRPLA